MNKFDEFGREFMDQTPIALPVKFKTPSAIDRMRETIRQEMSLAAQRQGFESFEEADDFDVGDDYDPTSPYEEIFEPDPVPGVNPSVVPEGTAEVPAVGAESTDSETA